MPKAPAALPRPAARLPDGGPTPALPPAEWLIVLLPDGHVASVEGGAPAGWAGRSLAQDETVPSALRLTAAALLGDTASAGFVRRKRLSLPVDGTIVHVELLLLEGLPLHRSYVSVSQLLLRTLDAFVLQAHGNDVDLRVEQDPDVPPAMYLDGEKIAWVVATLVGNALPYARPSKASPAHVRVGVDFDRAARTLIIRVKDNGPGMPSGRARWLFERDPATGAAAGLALLMVRDVLVAHRGSIEVESALGRGTTFVLRVPQMTPPA